MNILSLFDGISCARVALERKNIEVNKYYASEVDKYAIKISLKNYPDIIELGDIREITRNNFKEPIDLLIGGSPCQDLSIAKKHRKGLDGERSGLFWEYIRLLNEIKPKYFILENVNSMPKDAKQTITDTLKVEPIIINAALVSAQNRKRLFWTNIKDIKQPQDKNILLKDIIEQDVSEKFNVSERHTNAMKKCNKHFKVRDLEGKTTTITSTYYKIPSDGNYIKITTNGYQTNDSVPEINDTQRIRKLTPIECERLQCLSDNYTEGISNCQRYKCLGNAFNVDVVAHILSFIK